MHTHLAQVWDIDSEKMALEIDSMRSFVFTESYQEFVSGRLSKEVMLWTPGGETGDSVIAHYDKNAEPSATEWGRRMPYLLSLVEKHLDLARIRFMRLAVLSKMVHVPHRDFVEFSDTDVRTRPAHRLHVPLLTDEHCLFSENDTVYRMKAGEVWFLDVTREHSSAVLSDLERIHLIVDFVDGGEPDTLVLSNSGSSASIPDENIVERALLPQAAREALYAMGPTVDRDNLTDLFGVIAKKIFRYKCGPGFFWDTVDRIAQDIPDPEFAAHVGSLREYFLLARND